MSDKVRIAVCLTLIACLIIAGYVLSVAQMRFAMPVMGIPALLVFPLLIVLVNPDRMLGRRKAPNRHVIKPQGTWQDAPAAELDKSTTGKLLASRAHRDPSVHVVPGTGTTTEPPRDGLWDREIDG